MPKRGARGCGTPTQLGPSHQSMEVPDIQLFEDFLEIVCLTRGISQDLASTLLLNQKQRPANVTPVQVPPVAR